MAGLKTAAKLLRSKFANCCEEARSTVFCASQQFLAFAAPSQQIDAFLRCEAAAKLLRRKQIYTPLKPPSACARLMGAHARSTDRAKINGALA